MPIPADQIDPDARKVIKRLVGNNFRAYLVGGCVRDLLLERSPKDFDIATSATPNEVKALFRNCRIIGRRFRLAHIFFGSKIIETATFRANPRDAEASAAGLDDSDEADSGDLLIRRDNVFGTAEEDARRRDFTINGLFYDIEADQVIDYVGGLQDLAGRTVRTIGEPEIRFREDPVRMLRAIKFAARLDFDIEPAAFRAILDHQDEIGKCAPPRVLEEIYRLMRGGAARRSMELLRDTGVLEILMPEAARLLRDRPDSDEARWLWRVLERIDGTMSRKENPASNAVLLCALAGPLVGPAVLEETDARGRDVGQLVDDKARRLFDEMRASRRDVERARQVLLTLRRLAPSNRKRGKPQALVRRDWFEEALQVYELLSHAMRPGAAPDEELDRWRKMVDEGQLARPDGAEAGATPAEGEIGPDGRRRRRRRRGGRRWLGQGEEPAMTGVDGDVELDDDDALGGDDSAPDGATRPRPLPHGSSTSARVSAARGRAAPAKLKETSTTEHATDGGGAAAALADPPQTSVEPPSTGSTTPVR